MAKQKGNQRQVSNKQNKVIENYRNPAETLWGKIIIWVLLISMVLGIVIGLVLALINIGN